MTGAPTRRGLLDGNRIGRRKGVLEGFVERLFLAPTLIAIAIVVIRFAFRIGNHFGFSDDANFCALINEQYPFRVIRLMATRPSSCPRRRWCAGWHGAGGRQLASPVPGRPVPGRRPRLGTRVVGGRTPCRRNLFCLFQVISVSGALRKEIPQKRQ